MERESDDNPGPMKNSRAISESDARPPIGLFCLSLIAIFVGAVTGFGSLGFRGLIGFIHNLFFLGRFSFLYDANIYTPPSPWGAFVISCAGGRRGRRYSARDKVRAGSPRPWRSRGEALTA
jgi:hypothetical protein